MAKTIPEQFDALAVDDSLQRTESPLSNGGKWVNTWFNNNNIGKATATGWVTQTASKWAGAAWESENLASLPALVKATLAVEPATNEQNFILGLYGGTNALGNERGLFLEFQRKAAEKYYFRIFYRLGEEKVTTLGEVNEIALKSGDTIGLSFDGTTVKAWKKRGTEWTELLSKTGVAAFSELRNYSSISASGNTADTTYRLTNFATGVMAVSIVVPLQASSGVASTSLALKAKTGIALQASEGTSSATASLTAKTAVPLQASSGVATTSLAIHAPTTIPLGPSSGVASTSLALHTGKPIPLQSSDGVATATLALHAREQVQLQPSSGTSSATMKLHILYAAGFYIRGPSSWVRL